MNKKRLAPDDRRDELLKVAVDMAIVVGINQLRRDTIAEKAGVANGLVTRYFNTMTQLKRAVMRYAVHNEVLPVIAQGLAMRDSEAMKASDELKAKAIDTLG